jgi:hypothetical protein
LRRPLAAASLIVPKEDREFLHEKDFTPGGSTIGSRNFGPAKSKAEKGRLEAALT